MSYMYCIFSVDRRNNVNALPLMEAIKYLESVDAAKSASGERLPSPFTSQPDNSNLIKSPLV